MSSPVQRWSVLTMSLICLTLSVSTALAQTYIYTPIDPPFSPDGANVVTAITDLGKLAGTYAASDGPALAKVNFLAK